MDIIYIRKHAHPQAPNGVSFVVPAMSIKSRDGLRLIPHPYGSETAAYDNLEKTIEQIHRAGYAAEFEGKHYPLPTRNNVQRIRPSLGNKATSPVMRIIENALPMLLQQLNDSSPGVIASAAFAVGELRSQEAITGLIHALAHDDVNVRKNATEALAKIGRPALEAIRLALKDANWVVRHSALLAVEELLHEAVDLVPEVLNDAVPLLKDDSWLVRSQAATVFGEASKRFQALEEKQNTPKNEGC